MVVILTMLNVVGFSAELRVIELNDIGVYV